ncbi:MAG TPA: hypothetical protein VMA74_09175 [Dyella sp.]|nr:hypothetical protein [Dyella sp.]
MYIRIAKDLIVLIGGSDKGDQSAEIRTAVALVQEYKQRKKQRIGRATK